MTIGRIYSDLKAMFELLAWITFIFVLFVLSSRYLYGMDYSIFLPLVVMLYAGVWVGLSVVLVFDTIFSRNCKARDSNDKVVVTNWLDFDENLASFAFVLETIGRIFNTAIITCIKYENTESGKMIGRLWSSLASDGCIGGV